MKFCPECGSPLNGEIVCSNCEYSIETKVRPEKKEETNLFHGMLEDMMPKPITIELKEFKKKEVDYGEIRTFTLSSSGGMMGGRSYITLDFNKKELETLDQQWHHGDSVKVNYKVTDENILEEIKNIIIDNNLFAWKNIPIDQRFIAYDAPTSSVSIDCSKGHFSFSTMIGMTQEEMKIYNKIMGLVISLKIEQNKINEEVDKGLDLKSQMLNVNPNGRFCPDCGRFLNERETKCTCGTELPIK